MAKKLMKLISFTGIYAAENNGSGSTLYRYKGKDKEIQLTLPTDVKKVIRTNLVEDEEDVIPASGKVITLKLGHHSIETFKLVL